MHIIYGTVYSLLKLTSKRAPFVVVLDDQECVRRHFRSNCYGGELSEGTLSHPSLEDPYSVKKKKTPRVIMVYTFACMQIVMVKFYINNFCLLFFNYIHV